MKGEMHFSADEEKLKLKYLWQCLTDWKTYVSRRSPLPHPTWVGYSDDLIRSWNVDGNVGVVFVLVVGACYILNHSKRWPLILVLIIHANDHQSGDYDLAALNRPGLPFEPS